MSVNKSQLKVKQMSRTYRRKGFEKWKDDSKHKLRLIDMYGSIEVYEYKRFRYNHLDNHINTFSASREYRNHRMKQNRR